MVNQDIDIEDQLRALRSVTMPKEKEQEIARVIDHDIDQYRAQNKSDKTKGMKTWWWRVRLTTTASVAVLLLVLLVISSPMIHHINKKSGTGENHKSHQLKAKGTNKKPQIVLQSINYTSKNLNQIQQVAKAVGVTAFIPKKGQAKDKLSIVKNGGKGKLILDYTTFWLVESNQPLQRPRDQITNKDVTISPGIKGQYIRTKNKNGGINSFLYFKKNNTFISINNLQTGKPISEGEMGKIAVSFQSVK